MQLVLITATVWGQYKREVIEEKLSTERKSKDHVIVQINFSENFPKVNLPGIVHMSLRAIPLDCKSISDADLGELIRLIISDHGSFVSIDSIRIQ